MSEDSKQKANRLTYTSSHGRPIERPERSQRDGKHLLLKDSNLVEMLAHFNRENIPERPVHARGAGCYGEFEVTHDISDICSIDMLSDIGKKTVCVVRFSTTTLERGSSESIRDPKGMAIKFFTDEGNWDWVGLNAPIFFIRDPIKFPGMMHAQRRDPQSNLMNFDLWWEWVCSNHEALHMVLWAYSDYSLMNSYRNMSCHLIHAYKWVMSDGSWRYVRMFLTPDRKPDFEKARESVSNDPDCATRDLYESIEREEYPTWTAHVQVVDPQDASKQGFDILDITKNWNMDTYPENIHIPSRVFGKLTLKRNPQNYFSEIEQLAFSPSHLVPGVEPSEDPMLQARMFAYPDAQRYRLGVNYQHLPTNRAKHILNPLLRNGAGLHHGNYGSCPGFVSSKHAMEFDATEKPGEKDETWTASVSAGPWVHPSEMDYQFPRDFWKALPTIQSHAFQNSLVGSLSGSVSLAGPAIRAKVYKTFRLVSEDLADRVKQASEEIVEANATAACVRETATAKL